MIRLIHASAHATGLEPESVHMIATSPPYWGLRKYDGDQGIDWPAVDYAPMPGLAPIQIPAMTCDLGLEPTPEAYIGHLILVMREMWRVLRADGVAWVNLGDSYAGYHGNSKKADEDAPSNKAGYIENMRESTVGTLKPKDLCQIPARFALAVQADGWWVRSDIIWAKPNPMPESVTDRPTKAHEYIYLLSKSQRYYYDHVAVREPLKEATIKREESGYNVAFASQFKGHPTDKRHTNGKQIEQISNPAGRNLRTVWTVATRPYSGAHFATWPPDLVRPMIRAGTSARGVCPECGAQWERVVERTDQQAGRERNRGGREDGYTLPAQWENGQNPTTTTTTGWAATCTCNVQGLDLAPDDMEIIASPMGKSRAEDPSMEIGRAGMARPRGANEGQRPITRYQQRRYAAHLKGSPHRAEMEEEAGAAFSHYIRTDRSGARPIPAHLLAAWVERGWIEEVSAPDFQPYEPIPATVLDPFSGSGTTGQVSLEEGRAYIGIDISAEYLTTLAPERLTAQIGLGLA